MERFLQLILAGGLALVAGLWAVSLAVRGSGPWLAGGVLAVLGVAGLSAGIWREIES